VVNHDHPALRGRFPADVSPHMTGRGHLGTLTGEEERMAPLGPTEEEDRLRSIAPHITMVAPVEPRGWRELLRLATGLAERLPGEMGRHIVGAAEALRIQPAHVDRVVTAAADSGALAIVEGRLLALGGRLFLRELGIKPQVAEVRVADRIERSGDIAMFVVAVARGRVLGVLGVHR
jgi:cation transport ATPase